MTDRARTDFAAGAPAGDPDDRVPVWLAAVVLGLLVAVVVLGVIVARQVMRPPGAPTDPAAAARIEVDDAQRALDREPGSVPRALQLAYALQRSGELDRARETYTDVLATEPKNTAALYNIGVIAATRNDSATAEKSFLSTLAADPAHALAARALGELYVGEKRYDEAVAVLEPAVKAHPETADLRFFIGQAYQGLGAAEDARASYEAALKYSPDMTAARRALDSLGGER